MSVRTAQSPVPRPYRLCFALLAVPLFAHPTIDASAPPETDGAVRITGIYDEPVILRDGRYAGPPFVPGSASRPTVTVTKTVDTDLNADGVMDRLFVLAENSGGSGVGSSLAAMVPVASGSATAVALGDRTRIRSLQAANGLLEVDVIAAGPDDPACCPNQKIRYIYRVDSATLTAADRQVQGPLGIDDIAGTIWQLTQLTRTKKIPSSVNVSAQFDGEKLTGSSGCNRYFAPVKFVDRFNVEIATPGGTRMMCPPPASDVEVDYLNALEKVRQIDFEAGDLLLLYGSGGILEALRFSDLKKGVGDKL
jgi:heat shock protein HslJ